MRPRLLLVAVASIAAIEGTRLILPSVLGHLRGQGQKMLGSGKNATVGLLVAKLRQDIERLRQQDDFGSTRYSSRDAQFDELDTHYIFGVRQRGSNVSSFCGDLTAKQLVGVPKEFRDAVMFNPAQQLPNPVSNVVLSIPQMWFRHLKKGETKRPDVTLMVCYEGINYLRLLPVRIFQSDLIPNEGFMEYRHHHQFNSNLTIRGVALILDNVWNNAYLMPKDSQATLTADVVHERKQQTITRICTPSLLQNQECCLAQYKTVLPFGTQKKEITFSRCIGKITIESIDFPFLDKTNSDIAKKGGLGRRMFVPIPNVIHKVCRESRFRFTQLTIEDAKHGSVSKTLDRLDATECAIFY